MRKQMSLLGPAVCLSVIMGSSLPALAETWTETFETGVGRLSETLCNGDEFFFYDPTTQSIDATFIRYTNTAPANDKRFALLEDGAFDFATAVTKFSVVVTPLSWTSGPSNVAKIGILNTGEECVGSTVAAIAFRMPARVIILKFGNPGSDQTIPFAFGETYFVEATLDGPNLFFHLDAYLGVDSSGTWIGEIDWALPPEAPKILTLDGFGLASAAAGGAPNEIRARIHEVSFDNDCVVEDEPTQDCNENGIPDECDIAAGTSDDCNANSVPDACDIADGTSDDFNDNGIPDECDPDCNENGISDFLDIALGFSEDCNEDEIPDECQPPVIISSDPPDGFIEVRQDLSASGTTPQGIDRVRLTFVDVVVDADTHGVLTPESFDIVDTSGTPPAILEVVAIDNPPNTYEIVLVDPITPGAWTTLVAHVESECGIVVEPDQGDRIDIGFLPGDVGLSGVSSVSDVLDLIDSLNDVVVLPLEQTDVNRSDLATAADILRLIDLLNGANSTQPWNGASLPPRP